MFKYMMLNIKIYEAAKVNLLFGENKFYEGNRVNVLPHGKGSYNIKCQKISAIFRCGKFFYTTINFFFTKCFN